MTEFNDFSTLIVNALDMALPILSVVAPLMAIATIVIGFFRIGIDGDSLGSIFPRLVSSGMLLYSPFLLRSVIDTIRVENPASAEEIKKIPAELPVDIITTSDNFLSSPLLIFAAALGALILLVTVVILRTKYDPNEPFDDLVDEYEKDEDITFVRSFSLLKNIESKLDSVPEQWSLKVRSLHSKSEGLLKWATSNPEQSDSIRKFNSVTIRMYDKLVDALVSVNDYKGTLSPDIVHKIGEQIDNLDRTLNYHNERISRKQFLKLEVELEVIEASLR